MNNEPHEIGLDQLSPGGRRVVQPFDSSSLSWIRSGLQTLSKEGYNLERSRKSPFSSELNFRIGGAFLLPKFTMSLQSLNTGQGREEEKAASEFAIDLLLAEFHRAANSVIESEAKRQQMIALLKEFNPRYVPVNAKTSSAKAEVLAEVVAGIYVPFIHSFSQAVLKNIEKGIIPEDVIAPPRDSIPLAVSLKSYASLKGVEINILTPPVNRNTAGIENNQKPGQARMHPLMAKLFEQVKASMNGTIGLTEIETGIYGTTSFVMAEEFKKRGLNEYVPIKFYGLGPNLSYVHAILSNGKEWLAEKAEGEGFVDNSLVGEVMVLLDTMEELGMEKFYQSVENLSLSSEGSVVPLIVPVSDEELEIAKVTNAVIQETAAKYDGIQPEEVAGLLRTIAWLIEKSIEGFPFTLTSPIPSMDSKGEHFAKIKISNLFDCPKLII